jgi:phosphoribosylformylglycinamidine synthase subunit PurL
LMSESQERMMAIVEPDHVEAFMAICGKWDVLATVIGEVTTGDRLVIDWHKETVVDVPPRTVALQGPVYQRPYDRPEWQDEVEGGGLDHLERPTTGDELADTLLRLVGSPNLCDKSWVTDQYDRYVRGNSVLTQPDDAGMLRIDEDSGLGVALATDCNARFALLDPYRGAQLALAEAYRNVATTGAEPVAITDCLNFGSPEDPAIMWQFSEAVRGLADGCRVLGLPVTGGNVSFYNQTGRTPILPTPVVGVLGVIDDVTRRTPGGFQAADQVIYLLGGPRDELAGSAWADVIHDHLGGQPPAVDLDQEKALAEVLIRSSRRGLLASAHDLAEGGLAQALVESTLRHGLGARIELPPEADPFVWLFSESTGRAIVSVKEYADRDLATLCQINGVMLTKLGVVTAEEDATLEVVDQFTLPLERIREAWRDTIPAAMATH